MGIYKKLLAIQSNVRGLCKNADAGNGFSGYQYVSGSKVLDVIRPLMDKHGLLLAQQIDSIENERIDYAVKNGSKSELLTKVMMTFTWIDTESGETLPVKFGANGMNNWDKGLGSALTYAERYFLLKFFHISTDEDDVDALPPRGNEEGVVAKTRPPYDKAKWLSAVEKHAKGEEDMTSKLDDRYMMLAEDWNRFYADVDNYRREHNIE